MEYRFFQYGVDDVYIKEIVDMLAISHREVIKSEKWFRWRFEHNPCGEAIMSCAFDSGHLVACIAIEKVPEKINGNQCIFGLVRYYFVRESYGFAEIITRLIGQAEVEVQRQQLTAVLILGLLDYCSDVSIDGWKKGDVKVKYRVKFIEPLRSIFRLSDVKKTLILCRYPSLDEKSDDRNKSSNIKSSLLNQPELEKKWDTEYLCWRFLSTENPEYAYVNDQDTFAIAVVGIRGKVTKDVQILMMATKNEKVLSNHCKKNVADKLNELFHPDTISCLDNDHYLIFGNTIGVLHTIPVCYKWTEGAESLNITNLVHTVIKYNLQ